MWPAGNTMNPGQQVPSTKHCCCLHGRAGGIVPPLQHMHCCTDDANHYFSRIQRPSGVELVRGNTEHQYKWQPTDVRSANKNGRVS
ncbi:hypothetical protein HPB50_007637 [Hyalomma asiaticum]|uniref:Uncharacterized protein n=1 Tax=Hyalomma asiaticum TaxID=266040 RepID=A0ACB7RZD1_HYAAI|nr:hypothetical protein HPB50_007637 [Hyalomma asiaticum]